MKGNKTGAPSSEGDDAKSEGELQLVTTLFRYNSFRVLLRLYFHRIVVDVAQLVVGGVFLDRVHPSKDMRPVYLAVRGALGLVSVPISIVSAAQGSDVSMKLIALKLTGSILYLVRCGWLIYGTILVCLHSPIEVGCDKTCTWIVLGSVVLDWIWAVLAVCAALCPFCWALSDQWSTYLFMIYVAVRKKGKEKKQPPVKVA